MTISGSAAHEKCSPIVRTVHVWACPLLACAARFEENDFCSVPLAGKSEVPDRQAGPIAGRAESLGKDAVTRFLSSESLDRPRDGESVSFQNP